MAGFGQELRAERERLGVSVESLCAETKVNVRHFLALEEGNYLALPGGVFRRGIVRAYLKSLHLEEEEWLPRFQASVEEHARRSGAALDADEEAWAQFAENVRRNRPGKKQGYGWRWAGVLLLLIAVVAAGWAVWRYLVQPRLLF